MKRVKVKQVVNYWRTGAVRSHGTMMGLFGLKYYSEALFFGHITLEKALKALVVHKTGKSAPVTHNLLHLVREAEFIVSKEEEIFLNIVTGFNVKTRYPDYRLNFYKMADFNYTRDRINSITSFYEKLCLKMKSKE